MAAFLGSATVVQLLDWNGQRVQLLFVPLPLSASFLLMRCRAADPTAHEHRVGGLLWRFWFGLPSSLAGGGPLVVRCRGCWGVCECFKLPNSRFQSRLLCAFLQVADLVGETGKVLV